MRQIVSNYTFSPNAPGAGTVTLTDFSVVDPKRLILIVNVTRARILQNVTDPTRIGTVAGNVVAIPVDTSDCSSGDILQITYEVLQNEPDNQGAVLMDNEVVTFRDDMDVNSGNGFDATKWNVQYPAAGGASLAVTGGRTVLTAGTTNAGTIGLRTKQAFRLPLRVTFSHFMSQRIAGNQFIMQLTNAAGTTVAAWVFDGTSAASVKVRSTKKGTNVIGDVAIAISNSGSINTAIIDAKVDAVKFLDRTPDIATANSIRAIRNRNTPTADEDYFFEFFSLNTAAPATATTWTIERVLIEQLSKTSIELASKGDNDLNHSIPVSVPAGVALLSSSSRIGNTAAGGIWQDANAAAQAANATVTGATRDLTSALSNAQFASGNSFPKEYRVSAAADVAGTLYLEVSRDGTIWRRIKSVALAQAAGAGMSFAGEIIHAPTTRYARAVFINGATVQTYFLLQEMYLSA